MATGDQIGAAVIQVTADASGLTAGIAQATQQVKQFAQTANAAGAQAGKGMADGSKQAAIEAIRLAREQDKLTRSVTNYAQTVGKTRGEVLQARADALGLTSALQGQLGAINAAEAALKNQTRTLNQYGLTAKGQAAALRQVPAQITDIIVSLQGGQAPLTVLLQQGGQLKDIFGGVVPALRALGGGLLALINPVTVIATGVLALAFAYEKGRRESEAFNKALITSGNAAGTTANQLGDVASRISGVIGTQAQAAGALAALASTGLVAGKDLEGFATTAIRLQKALGTSVEDTAKNFADLGKEPVSASKRLNESVNFLTLDLYRQITALAEQGRQLEAGVLAQQAFSAAADQASTRVINNVGFIQRAYEGLIGVIKRTADAALSIGRPDSIAEQIAERQSNIERLRRSGGAGPARITPLGGASAGQSAAALASEQRQLAGLRNQQRGENLLAAAEGERTRRARAQIEAQDRINQITKATLSNEEKRKAAIKQIRADAELNGLSAEKLLVLEKAINEQYKTRATVGPAVQDNEATRYLLRLREINGALKEQAATDEKLTEAERERARFIALIAELKEKKILTADQKSLLASEGAIRAQLDINVGVNAEVVAREAALKKIKEQEAALERFRQASEGVALTVANAVEGRAEGRTASLSGVGRGDRARAELEAQRQLNREYEKYETQLIKSATRNGIDLGSAEVQQGIQALRDARAQELEAQAAYYQQLTDLQSNYLLGATAALENYYDSTRNIAAAVGDAFTNAFQGAEDALTEFFATGKLDVRGFLADINADLARGIVRDVITGPLSKFLKEGLTSGEGVGGFLGNVVGALFGSTGQEGIGGAASSGAAGVGLASVATSATAATQALTALSSAAFRAASTSAGAAGGGGSDLLGILGAGLSLFGGTSATAFAASSLPGDSLDNFFALNSNFTGRANGGIASAYNAYNVAENGPELLTVGNRQMLMMGAQQGMVTPLSSTPRLAPNITIQVAIPPGTDRRTADQIANRTGAAVARATERLQ